VGWGKGGRKGFWQSSFGKRWTERAERGGQRVEKLQRISVWGVKSRRKVVGVMERGEREALIL